jgi:2-hydroxychromene-2-carboxylate isomerase
MEANLSADPVAVTLYVDPSCPFAWITSRWLLEVAQHRLLDLRLQVMSLSVLNEGREVSESYRSRNAKGWGPVRVCIAAARDHGDNELEPWYREFNDRAWGPTRVAAAVQERHGHQALSDFYTAIGTRIHQQQNKDHDAVIAAALAEAGLPADLAEQAGDTQFDPLLRATHKHVESLVGEELGTPVIAFGEAAFFGPVCTSIPRGDDAVTLFEAVQLASAIPQFTELKRARTSPLSYQ